MKIPWKLIVFFAAVASAGFVAFDLFFAVGGDETLVQYEIEDIDKTIGEPVLQHIARTSQDSVYVRSEEIGL
ncbi:hypothetical protein KC717_04085 [Candidatus Dojkabacteria bacterium]|uniref:Uncharacterized protein n=1 Tax=Candidatus Dojkabacteria bacterium TaxID=2099670 RepID=A0A955L827_9BACT|nr:hypothetical protein [Candidatus Dojkabacteria bacterium]